MPFAVDDPVEQPNSLYAATKRADELIGHTYAHLYGIPATGLRFFTVYGPWGRPDMAPMLFTRAILAGEPIDVFNHGEMWRDFTYIDDIVDGVVRALDRPATGSPPHQLYNLGNNKPKSSPTSLPRWNRRCRRKAVIQLEPHAAGRRAGDLCRHRRTAARDLGFAPSTALAARHSEIRGLVQGFLRRLTPKFRAQI